jgi:hypothetical protein
VSAALTGLTPGAVYHAHVVITTAGGGAALIDGGDQPFTTAAPAAAATDPPAEVAAQSATLNGTVTPNGETITDCHFDYGADTNYGSTKPCASTPSGSSATPVSAALTGLTASTAYHYRVIVATAGAPSTPVDGGDRQFTTADPPSQIGPGGNPGDPVTTPGGPGTTTGGPGETGGHLTPGQLAGAANLSGTKTAGSDGTVKLGQLSCPLVCGKVEVTATMPSAGAARARKPPKPVVIGKGSTAVATGHSRKLAFKLTAKGRKALTKAKAKKLKLSVTVLVTDATGKRVKATRTILVKAPKRWH